MLDTDKGQTMFDFLKGDHGYHKWFYDLMHAILSEPENTFLAWLKSGVVTAVGLAAILVVGMLGLMVCGPAYR